MATVVNDLVTRFGFQGSTAPLKDYNSSLGGSIKLLAGMTAGLYAAAGAFTVWASGQLQAIDSLGALSHRTGVSAQALQEWSYMAEQSQSDSEAVAGTMRSLTAIIGDAAQRGNDTFARLGISVRDFNGRVKTADQILEEVRQRFKALGLSLQEQESFASALGIDASLLQLLNKTGGEMDALRQKARKLGILTAEQTAQAEDYTRSVKSMWFGLNAIKQLVAVGVAPEMTRLSDAFVQLLMDNKDWIVSGIQTAVKWAGNLLASLNRMLPVFALVGAGFLAAKLSTIGWAGALQLLSRIPIIALITAIVLVIDDLITAFRGGKSVIADFFKNTFDIDIVEELTKAFKVLGSVASAIFNAIKGIWEVFSGLINSSVGKFLSLFGGKAPPPAIYSGALPGPGGGPADPLPGPEGAYPELPGPNGQFAVPVGAAAAPSSTRIDNRRVEQRNDIKVFSSDPEAAGRAVDTQLQRQLRAADAELNTGGY